MTSIVVILSGAQCRYPKGSQRGQFRLNSLALYKITASPKWLTYTPEKTRPLDLLFTNSPSPINRVKGMPPIGKADHDIVYVEYDIKAKRIQQAPRKIFLYKRADMDGLHDHMARYRDSFLSSDHSRMSVNDMWVSFKSEVLSAIERFIPSKMTKTKYSLPWIDSSIKRLIRKRDKLYFRARKSSSPDLKNHYKRFRALVQKSIRDAYWKHVTNIFSLENDSPDPDCPRKNEKAKKFWSFVKSLKKDASGINTLRENGILKTDTLDKANICNRQFQSAFTRETNDEIPSKGTSPFTAKGEITVDPKGVTKLLNNLNIHKAPGPDGLSARVLKVLKLLLSWPVSTMSRLLRVLYQMIGDRQM